MQVLYDYLTVRLYSVLAVYLLRSIYKTYISIMNFIDFIFYPICSYSIFFLVCLELEQF